MDRFYSTGVAILVRHDALVERFMGDQVVGYSVPGFAGPNHARAAIRAGSSYCLRRAHTRRTALGPGWCRCPHERGYVGTVGSSVLEFTAMGEEVNLAALLASAAVAGELVASDATF